MQTDIKYIKDNMDSNREEFNKNTNEIKDMLKEHIDWTKKAISTKANKAETEKRLTNMRNIMYAVAGFIFVTLCGIIVNLKF